KFYLSWSSPWIRICLLTRRSSWSNRSHHLTESNFNPFQTASKKSAEVCLNAEDLARLEKGQVVVLHLPPPLKTRFLFNQMPSISVSKCPSCNKVFHSDDFEMAVLQEGHCPFCRSVQERSDNPYLIDES
ncbi:hypothetical protein OSTOST_08343, partial [Ostertagia ostertagi]